MNAVLKPRKKSRQASVEPPKAGRRMPAENSLLRTVTTEVTWRTFAADAFEQHGRDSEKASAYMAQQLAPGSVLFEKLVRPMIVSAIREVVGAARKTHNKKVWLVRAQPQTGNRLEDLVVSLLDTVLPNNVKLRDATSADLKDAAHSYRAQANTMAHKARWFDLIAQRVGTKTVAQVFGEDEVELRRLQKKAEA